MRLMRRTFLKSAAAGVATMASGSVAWAQLGQRTGNPNGTLARALYDVSCANFFDWRAYLDPKERDFAERCLDLAGTQWSQVVDGSLTYSQFTFSHRILNGKVNNARSGFGSIRHMDALRPDIAEMTRRRGVDPQTLPNFQNVGGVGYDVEMECFKLYALLPDLSDLEDTESRALVDSVKEERYRTGMLSYTIRHGKVIEKKVYVALRAPVGELVRTDPNANDVIHTNYMVTTDRGIVPQLDVKKPFDATRLGSEAGEIARVYDEKLGASLDTYSIDPHKKYLTLYFG